MQEVTRACLDCKDKKDVCLISDNPSIQRAFQRGPFKTYKKTDDECEVCGCGDALKLE